jgi:hypothetical protein
MAKFKSELPSDLMKVFEELEENCETILGEMCKSGAEVVIKNVKSNMSSVFESTESLDKGLKITKVYKTPSDDGINVHIGFYGYNDKGVPIPLIAQAREYGTSSGEAKKPFFRKSFKKNEIEQAMQEVQDKYIKGD